jgi:hypothetical protein
MSVKHRLLRIEQTIPFEDVIASWSSTRNDWMKRVVQGARSISLLAALTLELLNALTPSGVDSYWSDWEEYHAAREQLHGIALSSGATADGENLVRWVSDLEWRTMPQPQPTEGKTRGVKGPALVLGIGEERAAS